MKRPHLEDEKLIKYINRNIVPQDIKVSLMILKQQTDKQGECMIYVRLRRYNNLEKKDIIQRKIPTGIRVKPRSWSSKKQEVLKSDVNYKSKNNSIYDLKSRILNYINNPSGDYIFAQLKKKEFLLIEQVFPSPRILKFKKSLADYIDEYHARRKKLGHPHGTVKEFKTLLNRIKKFDDSRGEKTFLEDINITWSDDFELWLINYPYKQGTIEKTYTLLKTVLNYYWEIKDEKNIMMNDKFKSKRFGRGKKSKNKPNALTEPQLMALYNHKFKNKHLETIRKMVLLQAFTGIRYGDISRLRPENFKDNFLIFTPKKTQRYRVEVEQPLNPYSFELLKEVKFNTSCYSMRNQPYNTGIKDLFKEISNDEKFKDLKFKTNYTSHNFRDTFISIAVEKGVNWKSILKWVGQSSYAIMERYVSISRPFDRKEMKKMYDKE